MSASNAAIILAAGAGARLGHGEPKAFLSLGDRSMLELAMRAAAACAAIDLLVVAVPPGFEDAVAAIQPLPTNVAPVVGGDSRQASVVAALEAVGDAQAVVCHDAARPFASSALFTSVLAALDREEADGVVPVVPIADTVKRVRDGVVEGTESREELMLAQTPQAFRTEVLRAAHERAAGEDAAFTDDASVLEWAGYRVVAVPGEPDNLKITTPTDLARAEAILHTGGPLW
ncbi:MAG: 2-C-methyl-D-erythritol 4-phosphate cytidylyltransferase [Actinomycetota bacterium]